MSEWSTTSLGEIAAVVDCEHRTAPPADLGDEFGWSIGTPDIRGGRIDYSTAKRVSHETFQGWSRRAVLGEGDLILAREAPVGQVGRVDALRPTCLGQRTVLVRPDHTRVVERFLHAYLLGRDAQRWMADRSAGSTVAHLNVADVREIPVSLPPLNEQRRIAGVLGALDDLIDENRRFVGRVRELSSALYERIASAADAVRPLSDVATVNKMKVRPGKGTLRYLDIASMGDGTIEVPSPIAWDDAPSRARVGAADGATLWSTVRPNRRAHTLMWRVPDDIVVSTGIAVLQPRDIGPAELFAASDREEFAAQLVAIADGSAYPAVRPSQFEKVVIPRLDAELSASFEQTMAPLWEDVAATSEVTAALTRTRDELLPLLLSGEVRVSDNLAVA